MTPQKPVLSPEERAEGERARQLLAPLYGEAPTLELGEAAEYEAVRDLVVDWMEDGADARLQPSTRSAIIESASSDHEETAMVSPIGGAVWVRRAGKGRVMAQTTRFPALPGDFLILPAGCRAEVRLHDGSSLLLNERSRFVVGTQATPIKGRLVGGRLFAWVQHQVEASFRIATPLGTAAVLGTQFDLGLEEPHRLHLLVTQGKVEFLPTRGNQAGESQLVSRNHLLSVSSLETTMRRVSARELRRHTAWSRTGNSRRGRITFFGSIAVLVVAAAAFAWYHQQTNKPAVSDRSVSAAGAVAPAGAGVPVMGPAISTVTHATGPLELRSPCFEPGRVWRTRATGYQMNEKGEISKSAIVQVTVRSETLSWDPTSGARVAVVIEEFLESGDQSGKNPAQAGRRFEYVVAADGNLQSVTAMSGPSTGGKESDLEAFGSGVTLSAIACPGISGTYAPGSTWQSGGRIAIPGFPGTTIQLAGGSRFDGYANVKGVERGIIRERDNMVISGSINMGHDVKGPMTMDTYIDRITGVSQTVYVVDPQSGRVVEGEYWNQTTAVDGRVDMTIPRRPVVHQPIHQRNQPPTYMRYTVEYIQ